MQAQAPDDAPEVDTGERLGTFLGVFCIKLADALRDFPALPGLVANQNKLLDDLGKQVPVFGIGAAIRNPLSCCLPLLLGAPKRKIRISDEINHKSTLVSHKRR